MKLGYCRIYDWKEEAPFDLEVDKAVIELLAKKLYETAKEYFNADDIQSALDTLKNWEKLMNLLDDYYEMINIKQNEVTEEAEG